MRRHQAPLIEAYAEPLVKLFELSIKGTFLVFNFGVQKAVEILGGPKPSTQRRGEERRSEEQEQRPRQDPALQAAKTVASTAQRAIEHYSLLYLQTMRANGTGIARVVRTFQDPVAALAAQAKRPHLLLHKTVGVEPKYGTEVQVSLNREQQLIQRKQEERTAQAQAYGARHAEHFREVMKQKETHRHSIRHSH